MRKHILGLALAVLFGLTGQALAESNGRTVVTIAPRYLTAGTAVSSFEYRGEVAGADARFRPASYNLSGRFTDWNEDPWHVPSARRSYNVDWNNFFTRHGRRNY